MLDPMKAIFFLPLLATTLGLSSCYLATLPPGAGLPQPGPGYPQAGHGHYVPGRPPAPKDADWRAGYAKGRADRFGDHDARPERHRDHSHGDWQAFVNGYQAGHNSVQSGRHKPAFDREAHDLGLSFGRADRNRGLTRNYMRYSRAYKPRTQASFREGYLAGWDGR